MCSRAAVILFLALLSAPVAARAQQRRCTPPPAAEPAPRGTAAGELEAGNAALRGDDTAAALAA
jgi:hypothetical protein